MATITEDYVSFEVAKLLKEKGFNEETEYVFSNNGELLRLSHFGIKDLTNADCNDYHTWKLPIEGVASIISAPTLQMARKWLEEVNGIHLNIIYNKICDKGYWGKGHWTWNNEEYNSYEQACEEAIKYCLKHII